MVNFRLVLIPVFLLSISLSAHADPADTVLLGGKVVTVDSAFSIQEAVAIKDSRIQAVGSSEDISKHIGKETRVIQLDGKTVIPGLIDNHVHIVRGSRT